MRKKFEIHFKDMRSLVTLLAGGFIISFTLSGTDIKTPIIT